MKSMYQVNFLVIFIFIYSVFDIGAQAATRRPFVIFQPGEYFDPFTERPFKEQQSSASVTPQPNIAFGEKDNVFIQPFWTLPDSVPNSYPRTIAQTSGSAALVDAQIRQPSKVASGKLSSTFVNYKPNVLNNNQVKSETNTHKPLQSEPKNYPRTIVRTSGSAAQVDAQIREPQARSTTRSKTAQNHIDTANNNLRTLRRLSAHAKKVTVQPRTSHTENPRSRFVKSRGSRPSSLVAEASGQSDSLVDQSSELVAHPSNHGNYAGSKSHREGKSHAAGHHKSHSDEDVEDYKSNHHKDTKDFKKYDDHNKKSHHSEKGGNNNEHHDEAGQYKKYHEGKKSHKAAKFGEKKGHKKGHKTKGYHNKFHRDEYHREHRFYDDYHKEGYHEKHGDEHSKFKKKEGGHKNGGGLRSGHNSKKHGKKGFSDKGNVVDEHKGFNREGARKKYHKQHKDYHKKQGSSKGSKHGYTKEH